MIITREQLEKMFDEEFWELFHLIDWEDYGWKEATMTDEVRQFIFETIIPEVLKSVIPEENEWYLINFEEDNKYALENVIIQDIKQKAKENFWIYL